MGKTARELPGSNHPAAYDMPPGFGTDSIMRSTMQSDNVHTLESTPKQCCMQHFVMLERCDDKSWVQLTVP